LLAFALRLLIGFSVLSVQFSSIELAGSNAFCATCTSQLSLCEFHNIAQIWSVWESLGQHGVGVWINLADADGLNTSSLKAKV
jgi:hypothetical protein